MKIKKATDKYEEWLGRQTRLLARDLALKHEGMASAAFPFLRATFYRWMEVWPEVCAEISRAAKVLAVGDLHVENFGTWRDAEGRLVWGVNDFDEAFPLPYTNDLVRLSASALLAIEASHLTVKDEEACEAILAGYRECLQAGGTPFVLGERHGWLRKAATGELRDPERFWGKFDGLATLKGAIPKNVRKALESLMPERGVPYRVVHRVAGLGSLGRERYVAIAEWRGGKVAREAKALVPSACFWADGGKGSPKIHYEEIVSRAKRVPDPFVDLIGKWIVRRLAPDCSRVELASLGKERDETRLLHAMGWETGNVHLGSKSAIPEVQRHLKSLRSGWLHEAAREMVKATKKDWEEWKGE